MKFLISLIIFVAVFVPLRRLFRRILKEAGISTYRIRKEKIVSEGTLQSMREGRPVSTETIEKLCLLLDCTPNDLMKITR